MKPFPPGAFNLASPTKASTPAPAPPAWIGRSIATNKFRLIEHSAFVEEQRLHDAYHKHLFVHIGGEVVYSDPPLEVILIKNEKPSGKAASESFLGTESSDKNFASV